MKNARRTTLKTTFGLLMTALFLSAMASSCTASHGGTCPAYGTAINKAKIYKNSY